MLVIPELEQEVKLLSESKSTRKVYSYYSVADPVFNEILAEAPKLNTQLMILTAVKFIHCSQADGRFYCATLRRSLDNLGWSVIQLKTESIALNGLFSK
jgi:hypothetical protein